MDPSTEDRLQGFVGLDLGQGLVGQGLVDQGQVGLDLVGLGLVGLGQAGLGQALVGQTFQCMVHHPACEDHHHLE